MRCEESSGGEVDRSSGQASKPKSSRVRGIMSDPPYAECEFVQGADQRTFFMTFSTPIVLEIVFFCLPKVLDSGYHKL